MNKKILCVVCIILVLSFCGRKQSTRKYPSGKDTIESYGDGTYQLIRHGEEQRLKNLKYNTCIIRYVDAILEYNGKIYAIGESVKTLENTNGECSKVSFRLYAVIDLQNNYLQFCAVTDEYYSLQSMGIRFLRDDMIANKDAVIVECVADFMAEDWSVFQTIVTKDG